MMAAANLASSKRLARVLQVLRRYGKRGATSLDLAIEGHAVACSTDVSELRRNGYSIRCERETAFDAQGDPRPVWRYTLGEYDARRDIFSEKYAGDWEPEG